MRQTDDSNMSPGARAPAEADPSPPLRAASRMRAQIGLPVGAADRAKTKRSLVRRRESHFVRDLHRNDRYRRGRAHATEHAFQWLPGAPTAPLWQPAAATPDTRGGSLSLAPRPAPGALRCARDHPDHRRTSFVICCTSLSSFFAGGGGGGAIPTLVCCFAVTDS